MGHDHHPNQGFGKAEAFTVSFLAVLVVAILDAAFFNGKITDQLGQILVAFGQAFKNFGG